MTLITTATGALPRSGDGPGDLRAIAARVETRLDRVLQAEQERWEAVDRDLGEPLDALRRLVLQGGKRLRPAFCHWGFVASGGDAADPAARAAVETVGVAFELLHAFALVHDDVMDDADRRRGEPTTHLSFAARHGVEGWRGEARRFGESVAILVGDLAHVLADRAMTGQPPAVVALWRELQTELMMGQYLDVLGTARGDRSPRKASLVMQLKSGRYTVERPLQIGAALAAARTGRHTPVSACDTALDGYGRPLGEAFQLRDDVLGAFGTAAATGKPVGDDLREGKPTALLAHAAAHAGTAQRRLLDRVGAPDLTDDEVAALQLVLVETGARATADAAVERLCGEAVDAIDVPAVPEPARRALVDLARFIAGRTH
jgi:geranylgeranyl diphosphate synthase type I